MVTKVGIARGLTAAYLLLQYQKEMRENYAKGDWLEAAKDTGFLAITLTPVVAPNFFFGTVAFPVLTGVAIGVGATMVIVEVTGIGTAEEVLDLLLDPPSPTEWYEVVAPEVEREFTETVTTTLGVASLLYNIARREVDRRVTAIEQGLIEASEWIDEHNPFVTAPYLPPLPW